MLSVENCGLVGCHLGWKYGWSLSFSIWTFSQTELCALNERFSSVKYILYAHKSLKLYISVTQLINFEDF